MVVDLCNEWTAVLDVEPPGPGRLTVRGTACFSERGWTARLVPYAPQGANPKILMADLEVDGDGEFHTQVLTEVPVELLLEPSDRYDQVEVLAPTGSRLIDVEIVQ
jgi:hypothetical protein